jgi:hypothetical protein
MGQARGDRAEALRQLCDRSTSPERRELLILCDDVEQIAHRLRRLVLEGHHGEAEQRLRAICRADQKLRDAPGAPFTEARWRLTDWILEVARGPLRANRHSDARAAAELIAGDIARLFPALSRHMHNPERINNIAGALWECRGSRTSWIAIVKCWTGIEAGASDANVWRVGYAKWRAGRRSLRDA